MRDYAILTDATCDLSPDILKELEIAVIPMEFEMGGKIYQQYPDAREMDLHTFYDRIREGEMPKTTQINSLTYYKYFEDALQQDKDVLYICFSSGLSGTYQAALLAAQDMMEKYPEQKVICVDSLCASVGEGLLAYLAAQQKRNGLSIEQLADWITENRFHICHWFMVDDLNHLRRGGRISSVAAIAGSALGIKPILHIDEEGKLIPIYKVRGRKKGMERLIACLEETIIPAETDMMFIVHGDCKEDAKELKQMIKSKMHGKDIQIEYVGPIIGAHTGPGILAVVYFGTKR